MVIRCLESGTVLYQGNSVTQYQKIAINKDFSQEVLRQEELRGEVRREEVISSKCCNSLVSPGIDRAWVEYRYSFILSTGKPSETFLYVKT